MYFKVLVYRVFGIKVVSFERFYERERRRDFQRISPAPVL
jgi:hypothetical protein